MTKRRARRFEIRLPGDTSSHAQTADRWVEEPTSPEPAPAPPETTAHPRRFRPVPPPDPSTLPYEAHESEQSFPALPRELDTGEPLGRTSFPEGMGPRPEPAGAYTTAPPAYLRPDGEDPYVQHMPAEPEADDSALDAMGESAPAWAPADPPPEDVVIPGADEELALDREAAGLAGDRAAGFPSGKGGGDMKGGDEPEPIMLGSSAPSAEEMDSMDPDVEAALSALEEGAPDALAPLAGPEAPEAEYPVPGEGFDPREGRGEDSVLRSDEMQGADSPEAPPSWEEGARQEPPGGYATDADPTLPGRVRPPTTDMNAETYGFATDEDPVLPGHMDNEAVEAAAGIMDDEAAEGEPDMALPDTWEQDLGHDSSVAESENAYAQMPTNWETALDDEGAEAAAGVADNEAAEGEAGPGEDFAGFDDMEPALAAMEGTEGSGATLANPVKRPDPGDPSRRLDAGLPSEGDINTARDWDIPRRILHAIGSGLSVGAGGSSTPFHSNAERLEGLRREGLQGRLDTKDEYGRASMAADTARTTSENAAENARARLGLMESLGRERIASSERIAGGRNKVGLERIDVARDAEERAGAPTDVSSDESANRRNAAREMRDALLNSGNRRAAAAVGGTTDEEIDAMDADTLESLMRRWDPFARAAAGRPGGGGRSGGGGVPTSPEAQREAWMAHYGVDAETADRDARAIGGWGSRAVRTSLAQAIGRTDTADNRHLPVEILPGVTVTIPGDPISRRSFTTEWNSARSAMAAMNMLERESRDVNFAARMADPTFARTIALSLGIMRGMAARLNGSGIINPSELPTINGMIPDPRDPASIVADTLGAQLASWREATTGMIARQLGDRGASEDAVNRALRALATGERLDAYDEEPGGVPPGAAPTESERAASRADTITIRRRGGTVTRPIPRSSWEAQDEDFRARYEVVGGP